MHDHWLQTLIPAPPHEGPAGSGVDPGLSEHMGEKPHPTVPQPSDAVAPGVMAGITERLRWLSPLRQIEWWRWALLTVGCCILLAGLSQLIQTGQTECRASAAELPSQAEVAQRSSTTVSSSEGMALAANPATAAASRSQTEGQTTAVPSVDTNTGPQASSVTSRATNAEIQTEPLIFVDVAGAVVHPGLQRLPQSARLGAAVAAAGGLTKDAHQRYVRQYLNTAAPLKDGQKIYIPFAGEQLDTLTGKTGADQSQPQSPLKSTTASANTLVSINSATASELEQLPSIGKTRAQQIIEGRPYTKIEELRERNIVTAGVFSEISPQLSL